jgi:hypothetical protein
MSDTKPENQNVDTSVEQTTISRPSADGIKSIQGDSTDTEINTTEAGRNLPAGYYSIEGLHATDFDAGNVEKVYPKDVMQGTPPLTASAANDLNLAAQHAESTKATRSHAENSEGVPPEYWRIRSEISEHIAQNNIPGSLRADQLSDNGSNFPGYDVIGKDELASVKVFSLRQSQKDGQVALEPRYEQYRSEFQDITSATSAQNLQAADSLWKLKNEEGWDGIKEHLPPEVASANDSAEMAEAIAKHSTMRIPADQVEEVRNNLMERFGVSEEEVCRRVRSIDEDYTTAHYQAKAAEVWLRRQQENIALQRRLTTEE